VIFFAQLIRISQMKNPINPQAKEELVRYTREYGGEWGINHTQRLLRLFSMDAAGY